MLALTRTYNAKHPQHPACLPTTTTRHLQHRIASQVRSCHQPLAADPRMHAPRTHDSTAARRPSAPPDSHVATSCLCLVPQSSPRNPSRLRALVSRSRPALQPRWLWARSRRPLRLCCTAGTRTAPRWRRRSTRSSPCAWWSWRSMPTLAWCWVAAGSAAPGRRAQAQAVLQARVLERRMGRQQPG